MRTRNLLAGPALVLALGLTGCAEKADPEADPTPTPAGTTESAGSPAPSATADGQVVAITVQGGEITPNGRTVQFDVDQPVVLAITADEPGELHVHTDPEQEVAYTKGSTRHELRIDRPGVYEVESHDPHLVVVKLQVS
jgi:hypothetical protein